VSDAELPLRASTLELFFDLVFVFAITQLTSVLTRDVSVAIPDAFGRDGVALGVGYLIVVLIHGWLYQRVNRNIARVTPFNLAAALLVIAAGVVEGRAAYALWAAALAIHAVTVSLALSAGLGLALTAALWWAYFGTEDDERAERAMVAADPTARPALALAAYFYTYIPMLLGIVALASGVKEAIVRTGSTLPAGPCVAMGSGVALFLAGSAAFRHALRIGPERYRLGAAVACLAASWVGVALSVAAEMALLTLIVAAALVVESRAAVDTVPDSVGA